jgi:hypothetical protein
MIVLGKEIDVNKKLANPSTPCYEYLDQLRPYYNSPAAMHLALEGEFGLEREAAKHCVQKWLDYADRNIDHPWDRERFLRWRYQLAAVAA